MVFPLGAAMLMSCFFLVRSFARAYLFVSVNVFDVCYPILVSSQEQATLRGQGEDKVGETGVAQL